MISVKALAAADPEPPLLDGELPTNMKDAQRVLMTHLHETRLRVKALEEKIAALEQEKAALKQQIRFHEFTRFL